jgi:hypothetical protein
VKNYFSQLLNVHRVSDVRRIEIYTLQSLVPDPSPFEVEIATANLERYKSQGSDQILTVLFRAGGEILCSEIHKLNRVDPRTSNGLMFEQFETRAKISRKIRF